MVMKMVQSSKVTYAKSTYKENITSAITPYQLVGDIQHTKESLWEHNKKRNKYSMAEICNIMWFLMTRFGMICGKSLFLCELSDFWEFTKTYEDLNPLHFVVMKILQEEMNSSRTLCGRLWHYVDERVCPVGAIFIYLSLRLVISIDSLWTYYVSSDISSSI